MSFTTIFHYLNCFLHSLDHTIIPNYLINKLILVNYTNSQDFTVVDD